MAHLKAMDFTAHAAAGAAALSKGDALAAVLAYTEAIILRPSSPDFFTHRATALTRLPEKQYGLALIDAELAVLLARARGNRDKIQAAQQRRVVALFGLEQYANAAAVLETMKKWRTEKKSKGEGMIWEGKVQQQLKKLPEGDPALQSTTKEFPDRKVLPDAELVPLLKQQLTLFTNKAFQDANLDTMKAIPIPPSASEQPQSQSTTTSSSNPAPKTPTTIRHEWYQNAQTVTLTIYAKSVPKDQVTHTFTDSSLTLSFPHPGSPTAEPYTLVFTPLSAAIDPAQSTCVVMSTKIEIRLQKVVAGQTWKALAGDVDENNTTTTSTTPSISNNPTQSTITKETAPSYPTSSRTGPKNWDKVAADLTTKKHKSKPTTTTTNSTDPTPTTAITDGPPEDDPADDSDTSLSGDPVDGFFKKLYAGADADTRRAMMKSYQESGGTALSTDWKDVGGRRVAPVEGKSD